MNYKVHHWFVSNTLVALVSALVLFSAGCASFHRKAVRQDGGKATASSEEAIGEEISVPPILPDTQAAKVRAAYYYGLGRRYLQHRMFGEAIDNFKRALSEDSHSWYINYTLGTMFKYLGQYERDRRIKAGALKRAAYYFENALVVAPENQDVLVSLADVESRMGKYQAAVKRYAQLHELNPDDAGITFHYAKALHQVDEYRRSIALLDDVISEHPEHWDSLYVQGMNYYFLKDYDTARRFLERALEINKYNSQLVFYLGNIYEMKRRYGLALRLYEDICRVSPPDSPFYKRYVKSLLLLKKYDRAETVINELLTNEDVMDDYIWYYYLGLINEEKEQYPRAIENFKHAATLTNEDPRIYYEMSFTYFRMNRNEESLAVLENAAKNDPKNPLFYLYWGDAYTRLGNLSEALKKYKKGAKLAPEDPTYYFQIALIYEQMKKYSQLEKSLKKVLSIDKDHAEALNYLGYYYAEQSIHLEEAESYLLRALAIAPNNGAYLDSLGWIYYKQRRFPEAIHKLQQAVKAMEKPDPVVLEHLASAYVSMGCLSPAIKVMKIAINASQGEQKKHLQQKLEAYQMRTLTPKGDCSSLESLSFSNSTPQHENAISVEHNSQ